ncbi:MAG: RIP metalloprotease RseP [Candidatus Margulisiibacteriota bacterium]
MILNLIYFAIFFSMVVFVHELGHLLMAKKAGIGVPDFAIGFGPTLVSREYNGTTYKINILPLGGFVKINGLDDSLDCPPEQNYYNHSWSSRFSVILAGPLMNFALAFVLFYIIFSVIGLPSTPSNTVDSVLPDTPAAHAGLMPGDRITMFNNIEVNNKNMIEVVNAIRQSKGETFQLLVKRDGYQQALSITPHYFEKEGVSLSGFSPGIAARERAGPIKGIIMAYRQFEKSITYVVTGFVMLISGKIGFNQFIGPIGIAKMAGEAGRSGIIDFLFFVAFINVNLGIINLFPFPALDGGRLIFLGVELITGRSINKEKENLIHNIGMVMLLTLLIYITLHNDLGVLLKK